MEQLQQKVKSLQSTFAKPSISQTDGKEGEQEADKPLPPGFHDITITDQQRRDIYETLTSKLKNGEKLSEKQEQIYRLLQKQFGRSYHPQFPSQADSKQPPPGYPPSRSFGDDREFGGVQRKAVPGQEEDKKTHFVQEEEEVKDLVENPAATDEGGEERQQFNNLQKREEVEDGGAMELQQQQQEEEEV